ncbi:lysophospholipase [Rhizobium lentis]|uniref:Uncharacterized protein n=1 Tax=Rhizobium lentis TaxID=1138194 RepID=A0ABS7IEB2_9HYPH|nr:lysophospholipase [Rhizobium lentis]MBX5088350.1 hypothetical protein [Rhizobium lentis]
MSPWIMSGIIGPDLGKLCLQSSRARVCACRGQIPEQVLAQYEGRHPKKNSYFSRDPQIVDAMDADPLIAGESQPAATFAALVRASERLSRELERL